MRFLSIAIISFFFIPLSYSQLASTEVDSDDFYAIQGKTSNQFGSGVFGQCTGTNGRGVLAFGPSGLWAEATNSSKYSGEFYGGLGILVQDTQAVARLRTSLHPFGSVVSLQNMDESAAYLGAVNFSTEIATPGQIAYRQDGIDRMIFRVDATEALMTLKNTADHIAMSNGATLTSGGVWTDACSAVKKNLNGLITGKHILFQISQLPIYHWNYKKQPDENHIGPTAEDFHEIFSTGNSDKNLAAIDLGGVSIAAIQALIREKDDLRSALVRQQDQIMNLQQEIKFLKEVITSIESTKR